METTCLRIHHMSTSLGEYLEIDCPHCSKKIEFRFRVLQDGDMVVLDYGKELLDEADEDTSSDVKAIVP